MRLTQSHSAVDKEGVVRTPGRFADRDRGGVRQAVAAPDHEVVERVLRIQMQRLGLERQGPVPGRAGGRRGLGFGTGEVDRDEMAGELIDIGDRMARNVFSKGD